MARLTDVRLIAMGAAHSLNHFEKWNWPRRMRARHIELYENSADRRVWWFQTVSEDPQQTLRSVSANWPELVFLLDYENQSVGTKGMARALRGRVDQCRFTY